MEQGSENTLFMSETHAERAISKSEPLFTSILVESNMVEEVRPFHCLAQGFLYDTDDVFPKDLPLGLPTKGFKLTWFQESIDLIGSYIGVIQTKIRNYKASPRATW